MQNQQVRPSLSQHHRPAISYSNPLLPQSFPREQFLPQNTLLLLHSSIGPFAFAQPCVHTLRGRACQRWGIPSWNPALALFSPWLESGSQSREALFHPIIPLVAPGWKQPVPNVHWVVPETVKHCAPAPNDPRPPSAHQQRSPPQDSQNPLPTRRPVSLPSLASAADAIGHPLVPNARFSTIPIRPHEAPVKLPIRTLYLLYPGDPLVPAALEERYALRLGLARLFAKARNQARMREEAMSVARELEKTGSLAETMSRVRVPADTISPSSVRYEMRVLQGAGYFPHRSCPGVLAAVVKDFAEEKVVYLCLWASRWSSEIRWVEYRSGQLVSDG